jgi:hypothetical protein
VFTAGGSNGGWKRLGAGAEAISVRDLTAISQIYRETHNTATHPCEDQQMENIRQTMRG